MPSKTYKVDVSDIYIKIDALGSALKSLSAAKVAVDAAIVQVRAALGEKPKHPNGARSKVRGSSTRR